MDRVALTDQLSLSRIIYGMWRLGDDPDTSPHHVQAKVEACLEQGITTIDQADIYGDYGAEEIFGTALKQAPDLRDRIEIVTKCDIVAPIGRYSDARVKYYDTSAAHIEHSVEMSLKLMGIEQIDLLLVHRPDPFMDPAETGPALDKVIASGKVKAVGVSNFKLHDWTLLQSAMASKLVTNQIEISVMAPQAFTNGDVAYLQERGLPPMAWSPLAGGALFSSDIHKDQSSRLVSCLQEKADKAGVDIGAVAIAWLLAHPANILPVLGTNRLDRIASLSNALTVPIDRQDWFEIFEAANGHEVP